MLIIENIVTGIHASMSNMKLLKDREKKNNNSWDKKDKTLLSSNSNTSGRGNNSNIFTYIIWCSDPV